MPQILVPVDGSEPADDALIYVIDQFPTADITALHVMTEIGKYASHGDFASAREQATADAEAILDRVESLAAERDSAIDTKCLPGHPAKTIVEYATDEGVDHIVIGSTGKSGVKRLLLGSVAEEVVRRAPCPVTVIR